MARDCNLGAPRAMTTVVANSCTSEIQAHVTNGACSPTNPDFTIMSLISKADRGGTLPNVAIQTASYLRRRREFETVAYRAGYDALRGRVPDKTRRRENQKRGPNHDHYCEFQESCGLVFSTVRFPEVADANGPTSTATPAAQSKAHNFGCRSCSRYCLRAGPQCTLPDHLSGNAVHRNHHCAPVTAELIRPYPLGSINAGPSLPKDLRGCSVEHMERELLQHFWTADRLEAGAPSEFTVSCNGSFRERLGTTMKLNEDFTALTFGTPCLAEDLVAGFYYRSVQIATPVVHMCKIGYCRASWKDKCKRGFPFETMEPAMRFDEQIQRVVHQRRNLYDDARVNSHSPELLLRTGLNIQINVHHPDDAHKGLAICVIEVIPSLL